jgi:hypothetical protein
VADICAFGTVWQIYVPSVQCGRKPAVQIIAEIQRSVIDVEKMTSSSGKGVISYVQAVEARGENDDLFTLSSMLFIVNYRCGIIITNRFIFAFAR